jgi:hypothetical protein
VSASVELLGLSVLPRLTGSSCLSLEEVVSPYCGEEGVGPLPVPLGNLGLGGGRVDRLFGPIPPRSRGIIRMGVFELARSQSIIDEPFVVT